VSFAELDGAVIESRIVRQQRIAREGREFSVQFQSDWKIEVGPGDRIISTFNPTAYTPKGTRRGKTRSALFTLERPHDVAAGGITGHAVWLFDDGKLTFLRTFKGGGLKLTISFASGLEGLGCKAVESLVREEGVQGIMTESAIDGMPVTVLSAKQISADCRLTKQPARH
jgi:hypothetical protein